MRKPVQDVQCNTVYNNNKKCKSFAFQRKLDDETEEMLLKFTNDIKI